MISRYAVFPSKLIPGGCRSKNLASISFFFKKSKLHMPKHFDHGFNPTKTLSVAYSN